MSSTRVQALAVAAFTVVIVVGGNLYLNLGPGRTPPASLSEPAISQTADTVRGASQTLAVVLAGWLVLLGIGAGVVALRRGRQRAAGLALGLGYSVLVLASVFLAWQPLRSALLLPLALLAGAVLAWACRWRTVAREFAVLAGVSLAGVLGMRAFIWAW